MLRKLLIEIDTLMYHRVHGKPRHEWTSFYAIRKRTLIDGSVAKGEMVRRFVNGAWQYRLMTAAEDDEADETWLSRQF
ncbi:hypothetical protein X735_11230 [Mesorhizobium sp. L2C085B000]|uniref:hypothetical protein n=1 Tax=Mesorhizobium sp. L2C085B000 TaxID=1287117 RepID=UPI0003D051A1|nr:hypothetical protein [Mesorhizobium sp. L2C085B000]ESZ17725.1 hypothetical protein X735_11230 [Mesorhizobium sp. L2C085B000]